MKKSAVILLLSVLLIAQLAFAATANAEVIVLGFEDLYAPKQGYGPIPDGYAGFTWENAQWIAGRYNPKSGGDSGTIGKASLNAAFGEALTIETPTGSTFNLNGAYIKAVWRVGQHVLVRAWLPADDKESPGSISKEIAVDCTGKKPQHYALSLAGISKVTFTPLDDGEEAPECDPKALGGGFARVVLDNIEIERR